jgi:hypothetical protein
MTEPAQGATKSESHENPPHRHSKLITGFRTLDGALHWRYSTRNLNEHEDESIEIRFFVLLKRTPAPIEGDAIKLLLKQMENTQVPWLSPGRKAWVFDLDRLKEEFDDLRGLEWCKGRVYIDPEFKVEKEDTSLDGDRYYETFIIFYINPGVLGMGSIHVPPEIQESIQAFRLDYPDSRKVAFIMMKFGTTKAHENIVNGIKRALDAYGITAVRADEKDYHADLYPNVLTYVYGCGFGVAVFERIEEEDFNPNVSLEVGYMLALGKKVCLLKDQTLRTLQTDLVSKLYKQFDPQDPVNSISPVLERWLKDWHIV